MFKCWPSVETNSKCFAFSVISFNLVFNFEKIMLVLTIFSAFFFACVSILMGLTQNKVLSSDSNYSKHVFSQFFQTLYHQNTTNNERIGFERKTNPKTTKIEIFNKSLVNSLSVAKNANALLSLSSTEMPINIKHHSLTSNKKAADHKNNDSFFPKADINRLKLSLENLFSYARNSARNATAKHGIRNTIRNLFELNNMQTFGHKFNATITSSDILTLEGINIVGIRDGKYRHTADDNILLIGAHYDTLFNTSGVNDNGSGMSALLEIMRLINSHNCQLLYTVIFVAFDLEEHGGIGSRHFVHEYLIPHELSTTGASHFRGAIIIDTILNFNQTKGSQDIPYDIHQALPYWSKQIKSFGFIGDFLSVISRNSIDSELADKIDESWSRVSNQTQYKLSQLRVRSLDRKMPDYAVLANHASLLRSDHVMFWYHNSSQYNETLKAVLLTDTGPFRGYMRQCYHMPCDDTNHITETKLKFLKHTVETLTHTVVNLAKGVCSGIYVSS